MTALIVYIINFISAPIIAAYICRKAMRHRRSPLVMIAIIAALIASVVSLAAITFCIAPTSFFTRDFWYGDKVESWDILLPVSALNFIVGLVPSALVVGYFQKVFRNNETIK